MFRSGRFAVRITRNVTKLITGKIRIIISIGSFILSILPVVVLRRSGSLLLGRVLVLCRHRRLEGLELRLRRHLLQVGRPLHAVDRRKILRVEGLVVGEVKMSREPPQLLPHLLQRSAYPLLLLKWLKRQVRHRSP